MCIVLILVLLFVTPTDGNTALFFIIGGVGGMVDALLQTQLTGKDSEALQLLCSLVPMYMHWHVLKWLISYKMMFVMYKYSTDPGSSYQGLDSM